jgi:hypothetical protein
MQLKLLWVLGSVVSFGKRRAQRWLRLKAGMAKLADAADLKTQVCHIFRPYLSLISTT